MAAQLTGAASGREYGRTGGTHEGFERRLRFKGGLGVHLHVPKCSHCFGAGGTLGIRNGWRCQESRLFCLDSADRRRSEAELPPPLRCAANSLVRVAPLHGVLAPGEVASSQADRVTVDGELSTAKA